MTRTPLVSLAVGAARDLYQARRGVRVGAYGRLLGLCEAIAVVANPNHIGPIPEDVSQAVMAAVHDLAARNARRTTASLAVIEVAEHAWKEHTA